MAVRLVKYGVSNHTGTYNHDELENRDLENQHPISAITGLEDRLNLLEQMPSIENTIDTKTLKLEYEITTKSLTGNVKVFESEDNAIKVKNTGLFVDKYSDIDIEDTHSVHLTVEGKGETLKTMYDTGTRFSHQGSWSNIANTTEANAWYFDNNLNSFVQPLNTSSFTGFVSTLKYRTYTHRARLMSYDSDDDGNGLVIGYVKDDNGNPHTLSAVVWKGNNGNSNGYYLYYNYMLPNQVLIASCGNVPNGTIPQYWNHYSGWSTVPNGITMEVSKAGSTVEVTVSNWNETTLNPNTTILINLNDYSWGYLFKDKVQYGYCNQSQAYSYFTEISFSGKGPLKASTLLSSDEGNKIEIRNNGIYCGGSEENVIHETYTVQEILELAQEINTLLKSYNLIANDNTLIMSNDNKIITAKGTE